LRNSSTGRSPLRLFPVHSKTPTTDRLSPSMHPMTQLGIGVAALNHDSVFQKAYETGIKKSDYWTYTLEDCLTLIARLPALAARIYRNVYRDGAAAPLISKDLDLVGNYTALMGYGSNEDLTEYLRLYISIHGDHEGGNASAHTARKVPVVMRVSPSH
jgi:citrate synthase